MSSARKKMDAASDLLTAMANPTRLEVLSILLKEERSVTDLCEIVGMNPSSLSQHLSKLRDLQLVSTRREAQWIFYRCDRDDVRKIIEALKGLDR